MYVEKSRIKNKLVNQSIIFVPFAQELPTQSCVRTQKKRKTIKKLHVIF